MPFIKLSEQIRHLRNPQRSDRFVHRLRAAVRTGTFEAAELPSRFELPKLFAARKGAQNYTQKAREMLIDATPEFEAWFADINLELTPTRTGGKIKLSAEAVEAGLVDFKALAAETRRKMNAKFSKGQILGQRRSTLKNAKNTPSTPPARTPAKSAASRANAASKKSNGRT